MTNPLAAARLRTNGLLPRTRLVEASTLIQARSFYGTSRENDMELLETAERLVRQSCYLIGSASSYKRRTQGTMRNESSIPPAVVL